MIFRSNIMPIAPIIIFGMYIQKPGFQMPLKDKAMLETVAALLPLIQTWYVCDLSSSEKERGANGSVIADFLKKQGVKNVIAFSSVSDAMDAVLQSHCQVQCDRALIFGSFYTVAAAKRWLFNH